MSITEGEINKHKKTGKKRRSSSSSISSVVLNQDDSICSGVSPLSEVLRLAYCDKHVPVETLSPSLRKSQISKQDLEAELKKAQQSRINKVNQLMSKPIVPKSLFVPSFSKEFCEKISKKYLNPDNWNVFFESRNLFLEKLVSYWTLKRVSRNGQPILRRLQKTIGLKKKSINSNKLKFDSIELQEKYSVCKKLRQNLEKQRLLMELVRKRERVKYECIKIDQLKTVYELNPFNGIFLQRLLDIMKEIDKQKIFHQPVDLVQVPTYTELIKRPMDFSTIQSKINQMKYNTLEEFEADFNLIINNCLLFNPLKISIYNKAAVKLKEKVKCVLLV